MKRKHLNIAVAALAVGLVALAVGSSQRVRDKATQATTTSQPVVTTTSTALPQDPVIVAAGDISCPLGKETTAFNCQMDATAQLIGQSKPAAVLALGDLQYSSGELAQFQKSYANNWGKYLDITRPAPGNHEYQTKDAAGYAAYFGDRAKPAGQFYYSYDVGDWHLIALDSSRITSAQLDWLSADLEASKNTCTLAYWHHPRFSSGKQHGNYVPVSAFWQRLYDAGADVVLNGHEHLYERFAPQNLTQQPDPKGLTEFIVGTGGYSLYPVLGKQLNSEFIDMTHFGVLRMVLHKSSYDWQFVAVGGQVIDKGTASCH